MINRGVVDCQDQIAGGNAGTVGRGVRLDILDQDPLDPVEPCVRGVLRRRVAGQDAESHPVDLTLGDQLLHHGAR